MQDECQRLDNENKQLVSDLQMAAFKNEQLQTEIEDLTEMNRKMETQVNIGWFLD